MYKLDTLVLSHATKDNWENGCVLDSTTKILEIDDEYVLSSSLEYLINLCMEFTKQTNKQNVLLNSCDEIGRLDIQFNTLKPHVFNKLTDASKARWQKGEIDTYLHDVSFTITELRQGNERAIFEPCDLTSKNLKGYSVN